MRRISFSTAVLLAIAAGCAHKPQVSPTSIPVPLVSALIDDRFFPTRAVSPKYSVGQLPLGYPRVLAPTGPVTIVGGMTTGDETIAVFADSTRRLAVVMEQLFEQHGYRRPQPTPGSGFSSASGPFSYFCGDSGTVSVEPLAGANRASVRVTYRRQGSGYCRSNEPTREPDQLALPELKPPAGVHVSRSGGGRGSDGVRSTAEMTGSDLSAPTIVAHYSAQLVGAGWTAETPAVSQRVAAQYFIAKDASGGSWEGVLMASGSRTALTLSLTMHPKASR